MAKTPANGLVDLAACMHLQDRDILLCGQVCYLSCDQGKLPGNDSLHGTERLLRHLSWLVECRV